MLIKINIIMGDIYIYIYTALFKIIAVFKKVSKAQNLYNNFFQYTQMHWENCTFYSKTKHEEKYQICYYFTESEEK